jgi:ribosome-associated protein
MRAPLTPQGWGTESQAKALIAARAAFEKQAEGVVVMDIRALSTIADFFVVCTAGSARQIGALKEHIEAALHQHGCAVWHTEGAPSTAEAASLFNREPQWVLMDCGEIVVHLLDQRARTFYRLEELWADAPRIPVDHHT